MLNLSESGMLVVGAGVDIGDVAAFELGGPDFRFGGYAQVAHITDGAIGLHLLGWRGPANRRVRSLLMQRIQGLDRLAVGREVPGEFLG